MNTTSASLLDRLRQREQPDAWARFVQLYTPLLYRWAVGLRLREADAADLVQEVLTTLVQKLPEFHYDRGGSFRRWLRTVLRNKWGALQRRRAPVPMDAQAGPLADLPAPAEDERDEAEYREYLVERGLQLIRGDFEPATWRAWQEFAVAGRPAADVARELGLSPHAVYLAKARVLRRLREELQGLLDE